jgi:DNA modification methylase
MSAHRVVLGDCIEGLAALPDGSADHLICDPPFASDIYERGGVGNHQTTRSGTSPGLVVMKAGGIGSLDEVLDGFIREAARVVRRWVIVFSDVESVGLVRATMREHGLRWVRAGAWVKTDPMPQFTGDRPAQGIEAVCIAHAQVPGKMRWNGGGKAAVWTHGLCKEDRPDHPCPKPIPLMKALVSDFTDPGELIVDCFAGSGTTLVAAKILGRRALGFERDPGFHAIAERRIRDAREQMTIPLARSPKPKQDSLSLPAASGGGEAA